ncbi:MAG: hypothetical protein WBD22_06105 [Pyrinomonadaceae bacterium]
MNTFKRTFFAILLVTGASIAVSAQNNDQKRPPKKDPPVIHAPDKNRPKEDKPKGEDRGKKKPELASIMNLGTKIELA